MATLTVSVGAAKNPAGSGVVCTTVALPALASRARTSLSFVLLTPPAAPVPRALPSSLFQCGAHSRAPVFSLVAHPLPSSWFQSSSSAQLGAPVFSPVERAFLGSLSQSAFLRVPVCESGLLPSTGGYCFQVPDCGGSLPLAFILDICARIHGSPLCTSILSAGDVHL